MSTISRAPGFRARSRGATPRAPRYRAFPLPVQIVLVALLAAGCGALSWWGVEHPDLGLVVAMAVLTCTPIAVRVAQRRWDPFEPINLMVISLLILFVGRPIIELNEHLQQYPPYNVTPGFVPAMLIGLVGTASLYLAYFTRAGSNLARRLPALPNDWDADRSVRFAAVLLVIGGLLGAAFAAAIGFQNYIDLYGARGYSGSYFQHNSGYFEYGPYVVIPGSLILLTAWRKRRSLGTGILLALCVAITLALTVPRGDRTFILAFVLPIAVIWYLQRRRRPNVLTIVIALVVFMIAANVLAAQRHTGSAARRAGIVNTVVSSITHPEQEVSSFMRGAEPSEFSVLEIEAHEYQVGFLHYWPGSTLTSIAAGWIPHQILHTKPLSPLQHVTWTLFPSTTGGGSYGPTAFGSMFADDGWVTVVIFSALMGIGLRALWEYFRRHADSLGMQLLYAAVLPLIIILFRDDIVTGFAISVFLALPLVVCIRMCSRPPRRLLLPWRRVATG